MAIKAARVDDNPVASTMSRKELLEKAEEFRKRADELESADFETCLNEVRELVTEKHGFALERVIEALGPSSPRKPTAPDQKPRKAKVKYADQDGNTWSGQGRMANWLKRRQEAGDDIEKFRV